MNEIIVALITGGITLLGVIISNSKYGVRPALILPSTALFNPDTLEFVSA